MLDLTPSELLAQQRHVIEQDRLRDARLARFGRPPSRPAPGLVGTKVDAAIPDQIPSTPESQK